MCERERMQCGHCGLPSSAMRRLLLLCAPQSAIEGGERNECYENGVARSRDSDRTLIVVVTDDYRLTGTEYLDYLVLPISLNVHLDLRRDPIKALNSKHKWPVYQLSCAFD